MDIYEKALKKIKHDQKCRPICAIPITTQGPAGPTGPQGIEGPTGPAPSFEIGTVTTGAPGTPAIVTLTPIVSNKDIYYMYSKGGIK